MPKKKWEKPKLIVLVRGRPEEMVLTQCKGGSAGPDRQESACGTIMLCGTCDEETPS